MKLDFSKLAQSAAKVRGQVGTTGTPASTRVCASPIAKAGVATTGDKAAALADLVVAPPAACPPVSPVCPHAADGEQPKVGAVSPVSPLVPIETVQDAAPTPSEREEAVSQSTAPIFIGKMSAAGADRPHRLSKNEADRCHSPCWDDIEIAAFTARAERFALLGRLDADDLAERLTLRDRDGDDRRLCLECTWLGDTGRCLAAATGRIRGADRRLEPVQTILQRCDAFGLRKGLV